MRYLRIVLLFAGISVVSDIINAQNPFIRDQFTADPTARVFNGRVYVYPSHDIPAPAEFKRKDWFCMEDYHVFSSADLIGWTDHGIIVHQKNVNWVDPSSFSMWAPDCIEKNGKYYFYFPSNPRAEFGKGFTIGVAVSDNPAGPFVPQPEPVKNIRGIDPNVFIDRDGQAYLYWSMNKIFGAKLKENMLELATEPQVLAEFPAKGLVEGPYLFERNGIYYMTYPHVENKTERLEYAISNNPMGPFRFAGVIMDESPTGCWTNHHSIIKFMDQWYLFYHHNDLSPKFDKNRSVRIDSLFFNTDGTIRKVVPTLRGVGVTNATGIIEIDRFSETSQSGVSAGLIDPASPFKGWKAKLEKKGSWVRYNNVDFGSRKLRTVMVKASSETGGILEIRLDNPSGELLATVSLLPNNSDWNEVSVKLKAYRKGVHNLVVVSGSDAGFEIDWVKFGK